VVRISLLPTVLKLELESSMLVKGHKCFGSSVQIRPVPPNLWDGSSGEEHGIVFSRPMTQRKTSKGSAANPKLGTGEVGNFHIKERIS